jgi:methylmalonyl-CoA/ethylmalonyl-CoA epimerase
MAKVLKVNHTAIVVGDMDAALTFWRDALGLTLEHSEDVPSQKAQVAFLPLGGTEVELVKPTSGDSGLAKFLTEHGGT